MSAPTNKLFTKYYNPTILGLSLVFLILNYDVLLDLFHKWYARDLTGTYSHGLLVAVIVIYLVFKKIVNIRPVLSPTPSVVGLVLLFGSQSILILAKLAGINFVQHIALVTTLLTIIWAGYSFRFAKQFILPAVLLSMSFPLWTGVEFPLQKVAIFTTNSLLSLTNLPYYHEGALFHFPNGIIEIAPECAGLQQLLVSIIIGLLFSMQYRLRARDIIKTLIYISIAAILINTIRIIIIMIVGYYTKMESSLITKHILLGWIIYGVGIYIFLYFYSRVKFKSAPADASHVMFGKGSLLHTHAFIYVVLAVLILLPSMVVYAVTKHINNQPIQPLQVQLIKDNWRKISDQIPKEWEPAFPVGDELKTATFSGGGRSIYVYINNYAHLKKGIEPINMDNMVYNWRKWTLQQHKLITAKQDNGENKILRLDVMRSRTSNQRLIVVSFYVVNGKIESTLTKAKLAILFGMLRLNYDIKVVCLATLQDTANNGGGVIKLSQFIQALQIQ